MAERLLVVGATGYIGRYIAKASSLAGLRTSALVRPSAASDPRKKELLDEFRASGIEIVHGSLDDHQSLIAALKYVDIVISAVGIPQLLAQLRLIDAMKEVGTVKRFLPSEFGSDVDKLTCLKPCQDALIEPKVRVRRATEAAKIPHTYVVTNGFAKFHFNLQERDGKLVLPNELVIYGDGNAKTSFVVEEDIGFYTVKAASDPRTSNKTLHIRPPRNALSRNETIAVLESESGKTLPKKWMTRERLLEAVEEASGTYQTAILALMYSAHIKGDAFNFELGPEDIQADELYPDYEPADARSYLRRVLE